MHVSGWTIGKLAIRNNNNFIIKLLLFAAGLSAQKQILILIINKKQISGWTIGNKAKHIIIN